MLSVCVICHTIKSGAILKTGPSNQRANASVFLFRLHFSYSGMSDGEIGSDDETQASAEAPVSSAVTMAAKREPAKKKSPLWQWSGDEDASSVGRGAMQAPPPFSCPQGSGRGGGGGRGIRGRGRSDLQGGQRDPNKWVKSVARIRQQMKITDGMALADVAKVVSRRLQEVSWSMFVCEKESLSV